MRSRDRHARYFQFVLPYLHSILHYAFYKTHPLSFSFLLFLFIYFFITGRTTKLEGRKVTLSVISLTSFMTCHYVLSRSLKVTAAVGKFSTKDRYFLWVLAIFFSGIIKYHKLRILKWHKWVILQYCWSQVWVGQNHGINKAAFSFLEAPLETPFHCLLQFLEDYSPSLHFESQQCFVIVISPSDYSH